MSCTRLDAMCIAALCLVGWTGVARGQGGAVPTPATITISNRSGGGDNDIVFPIHLIRTILFDPCRDMIVRLHDGTEMHLDMLTYGTLKFVPCERSRNGGRGMPMAGLPDISAAASAGLAVSLFPNPTSSTLAIEITSDRNDRASVAIYDLTGNIVWTRDAIDIPAGASRVIWDGANTAGAMVPTGTYIVRVAASGRESAQYVNVMK